MKTELHICTTSEDINLYLTLKFLKPWIPSFSGMKLP